MTTFFVISLNVLSNPLIKTKFYWEIINAANLQEIQRFQTKRKAELLCI